MPIIKSVGLDLALTTGADFNPITLQKNNISRIYSPRATLVNPKIIMGKNPIQTSGTKSYAFVITAARRAI